MPDRMNFDRRLQEVAPGEYAEEVYTRDMWSAAIANGRAFLATSRRITTDVTNTHINATIKNTSADQLVTVMMAVANIAPDAMVLGTVQLNPTTGLPTTTAAPFNLKSLAGGGDAAAFTFAVDPMNGAMTGGTATDLRLTTHKGRNELQIGLPLAPGATLGVGIPLGLVAAGDGSFAVYVVQEPL